MTDLIGHTLAIIFVICVPFIYFWPSITAFRFGHGNRWLILIINIFFGFTLIGYLICLFMAYANPKAPRILIPVDEPRKTDEHEFFSRGNDGAYCWNDGEPK
jgi:hypothetical protein